MSDGAKNLSDAKKNKPKPAPINPTVQVSFVFEDCLMHPIEGLSIKVSGGNISSTGITDANGFALEILDAPRDQALNVFVKKRSGSFEKKGTVTPKRDVNAYTIRSPELHLEATTKQSPKDELEEEIKIPTIKEGEVMTIERLFGDLAPFLGAIQVITEVGKVTKDFPKKIVTQHKNEETGKIDKTAEIEHHFKVVKTDKPHTIALNLLGSKLNYPAVFEISEDQFKTMAKELDCEIAAIKAVTYTETGGTAFYGNGLPKILFERHKFFGFTAPNQGAHPYAKFPNICNPAPGGYGPDGVHQYERLLKAAKLDKEAAIKSCSWGAFQVLAEYYDSCGYGSATELANDCMRSVDAHAKLFLAFMKAEKAAAIKALKEKDWVKFTRSYNGNNWRAQNPGYPAKMADYYDKFK